MSDYRLIPLSKGQHAKVSPEDYDRVAKHSWYVQHGGGYAARTERNPGGAKAGKRIIYMHRLIMNAPPRKLVDHINGDQLDNRRTNLRLATSRQNLRNRQKVPGNKVNSVYRGVQRHNNKARRKPWSARVVLEGKQTVLGYWPTQEQAARAYDAAALHYYGEFAAPNFADSEPATVDELRALARTT